MATDARMSLEKYLAREYRYTVTPDPDQGAYVIEYPDLPGCVTQVDSRADAEAAGDDARRAWIETAYELGREIPPPSYPDLEEYSGRILARLPKKLHRELAQQAKQNGVSLNTWIVALLSERAAATSGAPLDVEDLRRTA